MIDIHCHLLNGVDDGCRNIIESLTNIKLAEEAGFTDIILTPHFIEKSYDNSYNDIKPKVEDLQEAVNKNQINIKLHQGNEAYFADNLAELIENNTIAKLAESKYVLFELPLRTKVLNAEDVIYKIKAAGYVPVLAHPERYAFIQKCPNEIKNFVAKGVLIQCNYGSVIGQYGKDAKKTLIKLLKQNLVHFLGTDTHRHGFIYGHFGRVEKEFLKYISKEKFKELCEINPQKILSNTSIEIDTIATQKRWWIF